MSFEVAAAIPEAFMTAFDAVFLQMGVSMGEKLLIHAVASGVGTAALQLAREAGVYTIGTSRSNEKLQRMKEMGLDLWINSQEEDFAERIKTETNGKGVHAVLDLVGAKFWKQNLAALAPKGRMILVGMVGGASVEANLGVILMKRLNIVGTVIRSRPLEEKITLTQEFRRRVIPLFEEDRWTPIVPVVDRVLPIESAADAHLAMEGNENVLKIGAA